MRLVLRQRDRKMYDQEEKQPIYYPHNEADRSHIASVPSYYDSV